MVDIAREVLGGWSRAKRPPTYLDFARTLWVPNDDPPPASLPYNPLSDPIQKWLIEQMDLRDETSGQPYWDRFYVCAPPQWGGKTLVCVILPSLRAAIGCRLPVGYALPTLSDVDRAWQTKVKKAIRQSGYSQYLPKQGPGSKGGRGAAVQFVDPDNGEGLGEMIFMAGGAYGSTVAVACVDEADQFRDHQGNPLWDDLEDIFNRANAYRSRALRIAVGTVEHDQNSIILVLVDEHGTGTRIWPKCQHCGRHQLILPDQFSYDPETDKSARNTAHIACRMCGAKWSEPERRQALYDGIFVHRNQEVDDAGRIVGPDPNTRKLGLLWTAFDSVRADLGQIAQEHRLAKLGQERGDHGLMQKWERYRLCCRAKSGLDESGQPHRITTPYLEARSAASDYALTRQDRIEGGESRYESECPPWVEWLSVSSDVQRGGERSPGRLYYLVQGWNSDGRTWDLAWGTVIMSPTGQQPTTGELHAGLDTLHHRVEEYARSIGKSIAIRGVDVADRQDEIVAWLFRNPKWLPLRGTPQDLKPLDNNDRPGWLYHRTQSSGSRPWNLWLIPVDDVQRQAQAQFLVPVGKPGSAHIPRGLSRQHALIVHYCAVAWIKDDRGRERWSAGKQDRQWHHEWHYRHDLLDCRMMALAIGYWYNTRKMQESANSRRKFDEDRAEEQRRSIRSPLAVRVQRQHHIERRNTIG